jgi:ABC-type bacteriocin/lantibiotic exporter with double-glycine peptidase domain
VTRWETFRRLMAACRSYKRKLVVAFFCAVGVALALPSIPLFIRAGIDGPIARSDFRGLTFVVVAMLAVAVFKAILHGIRRQIAGELSIGVEGDLREHLF